MNNNVNNIAIEVKDVYKSFGFGENVFEAIKGISLSIEKGSFVSLVGKSGSGKSTMLHMMAALDEPSKGKIFIYNKEVGELSNKERCLLRNEKIGFIFQSFYLEENYTVYKNVEMPLIINGMSKSKRKKLVLEVLDKVGLKDKMKNKAAKLSGGEKQRVAIARAIVNKPKIVFADEPCGNLDTENGEVVMKLLKDFANRGVTVVLVTHNLEDAKKTERIISLKDGKVISDEYIGTGN